ncbi:MAG: hypothetical protein ACREM8_09600, partial [Vulcanimicrobiaceae bacterium]
LETGTWVVRAGATGISGIIAPDGRYTVETKLGETTVAIGKIGHSPGAPFVALGTPPVAAGFAAIYLAAVLRRKRRRR